jgi:hypothetical protein|tara:strand:+ start:5917 stop:6204 length:288 start_codon:yes stop_codon:yes gene_type:complete
MNNVHYKDKPPRTWLPTLRAFEIMFYPATANKGERVRIKDTRQDETKFLPYCYKTGSIIDQAYDHLTEQGLSIDHMVPLREGYLLITNDHKAELT